MVDIPRLEMDQLAPRLAEALRPRVERLGYLGEFFKITGHQPDALMAFMDFTETSKGGLANNFVELVALSVSGALENDYERHQHERLSVKLGLGADWVTAANKLAPDTQDLLSEDEKKVQALVLCVIETKGHGAASALDAVVDALGHEQAVAVLLLIGRYVTHGMIVNTLGLAAPVASIFEEDGT